MITAGSTLSSKETGSSAGAWEVGLGAAQFVPADYDPKTDTFGKTYYIAGYNNGFAVTGMLDPQCVRAAYIGCGEMRIAAIAVDCVGLTAQSIENIRRRIAPLVKKYALSHVHIASTHTHAGIDTMGLWGPIGIDGKDPAFMELLYDAAAEAAQMACQSAKPGRLFFGSADTGALQRDSRKPEVYDRNLYRLRFAPDNGEKGVQILSYDAHAESLRGQNTLVSADYPFYMGQALKEATGDDYVFFAGAVGGLIMTHVLKDENGREYDKPTNARKTGEYLANAILSCTDERELLPEMAHASREIDLELDNSVFLAMANAGVLDTTPVPGGSRLGLALRSRVSLLQLGGKEGICIAMVPGELFPELAHGGVYPQPIVQDTENPAPLCETLSSQFIVWGLCDDEVGYIVSPTDFILDEEKPYLQEAMDCFGRRHYEETNSVGPKTATSILCALGELAKAL